MNKYFYRFIILNIISSVFFLESCWFDKTKPNVVYMPDMYYSEAYEPYSDPDFNNQNNKKIKIPLFKEKTSSLFPVKGTISRNYLFYNFTDFENKGLNDSKNIIQNPLQNNHFEKMKVTIKKGEKLYKINCSICHGKNGDGQGELVKNEKILGVPNYKDRDITIGSIYYVITYGKNNMSSYASQLNETDRWRVSEYVMFLKKNK
ncbi:Cytochrome C Class I [Blattabacterium sp. (Nauphoeta cinerea)]|uniref:c-type cytochrome n=1 Tax=Blattabacterium sp. (Nauphoeta cinerea) TaxID=1316444 RepID=UPI0003B0D3E7|nr:cytochrome c [Blattabacterium sp. (Nauphoeta cinerea)]AGW86323.1 Cytochrome C Class I [Blattabacterium sp. (Nauphoeta cinerea)]